MISGKLPNNTVWWLSRDGLKIWIESKDLEEDKFKEKRYNIAHGRIFHAGKDVGELATSRLDSRRYKDAWIIKLKAMSDVYPALIEEIRKKEIEEHKKKRVEAKKELKTDILKEDHKNLKKEVIEKDKDIMKPDNNHVNNDKEPMRDYFDINRPYVTWIKDKINKSVDGKIIISLKDIKNKMGTEFERMNDYRIYFGLNKILPNVGMTIELRNIKRENIAIIKKNID